MKELKKLNIGCGNKIFKDYVNIDFIKGKGVDLVYDLNEYPWPFKNDSIEEIYCDNVLEHLDNFDKALKEINRMLKSRGKVIIKVPYFSNPGAFNPNHRSFFSYYSLDMYCTNTIQSMDLKQPLFRMLNRKITFLDEYNHSIWIRLFYIIPRIFYKIDPKLYIWLLSYRFPASELHFKMEKL